jgi:hypothetical protein
VAEEFAHALLHRDIMAQVQTLEDLLALHAWRGCHEIDRNAKRLAAALPMPTITTWGQTLVQHLHLHCVVPGGALARDGSRWIACTPGFLFPVRALAMVFRGKYLAGLRRAFDRGELRFAGSVAGLAAPTAFGQFLAALRAPDWVVYAKPPFGGPTQVLEYLGRYTHRVDCYRSPKNV